MTLRRLLVARHGMADPFGALTPEGRRQADLLGARLAGIPIDALWHSPLPRAVDSAGHIARHLPGVAVDQAPELTDHVPYVPDSSETPSSWVRFFDGYDPAEATSGSRRARQLVARFATPSSASPREPGPGRSSARNEVLITHAYPIAWLLRHALDAPSVRWLSLTGSANSGLTVIEYPDGLPPTVVMFNDVSHLPTELRWTGFAPTAQL